MIGREVLEESEELGLCAFDGAVEVGAFDVDEGGVVLVEVVGVCEEGFPVLLVHDFAEDVLHVFALTGEFSHEGRVGRSGAVCCLVDGVACSVSEELLNEEQFFGEGKGEEQE